MTAPLADSKKVLIVAGEASGDLHGGNLLRAAGVLCPHLEFFGVGGEGMKQAGCRLIFPSDELSVMGLVEVFSQLPRLLKRFHQLKNLLQGPMRPDLLILIDFPDFNLRLAKVAQRVGVPVLYYISPKVWAWRRGRARTIAARVDRLALIFPFEPEIYRPLGVVADYVGNPLLDEFVAAQSQGALLQRLAATDRPQLVGIFPGSRKSELRYIFPTLLETARRLHQRKPELKFLLPVAPSLPREFFQDKLQGTGLPIALVDENIYQVAATCDAILCVSGTVTLQIALVGTPLAIVYKVAPLSYAIGRRLIKIPYAGLPNIIAGKEIAREFIQGAATPANLTAELLRLLDDRAYAARLRQDLAAVKQAMGGPGCSARVAKTAAEMVAQ